MLHGSSSRRTHPWGRGVAPRLRHWGGAWRAPAWSASSAATLARARETAQAIAATTGLPVLESALLQERNFGQLRGLAYDGLGYDPIDAEQAPPGASR
jgi:broad specificity phosphatase PhoE